MIDEENKSATMPETSAAPATAPVHAAPAGHAPWSPRTLCSPCLFRM